MTHLQRLVLTVLDSKDEQFVHYENKAGLGRCISCLFFKDLLVGYILYC